MKRHLLTLASMMLYILPAMANPHGKDYSVNGGHGSGLTTLFIIVMIGFVVYAWISSMFNRKNKK